MSKYVYTVKIIVILLHVFNTNGIKNLLTCILLHMYALIQSLQLFPTNESRL